MSKLSSSSESAGSAKMLETVESKLVQLQSQLQALRDQHERGDGASAGDSQGGADRGAAGRGRGRGRAVRGGGRFAGRGAPWAASSPGRGRGRGAVRLGNQSIDHRPRALVVESPPSDFVHIAESHFSRYEHWNLL